MIENLKNELITVRTPVEAKELVYEIIPLLDSYLKKRLTPVLPMADENHKKNSYTIEEVLSLKKRADLMMSKIELKESIEEEHNNEIEEAGKELSKHKLIYLNHKKYTTQKLIYGLVWIKTQLKLSILILNKNKIVSNIKGKMHRYEMLIYETKYAIRHVVISELRARIAQKNITKIEHRIIL